MNELDDLLNEFKDLRRNGYVSALMLNSGGKKIAGIYGVNIPREFLWALDIVPINLYSIDDSNIKEAEKAMDKNYCSLIKASYGYAILDKCPYIHFSDIIIGNDYCSEKVQFIRKLSDLKKVYIINEQMDEKSLISEYEKFIYFLENEFNVKLKENKLLSVIKKVNEINIIIDEIIDIYMSGTTIMNCYDLFSVIYGSQFVFSLEEKYNKLFELKDVLEKSRKEKRISQMEILSKVLIIGAPLGGLSDKILKSLSEIENIKFVFTSFCEDENYNLADENINLNVSLAQKYSKVDLYKKIKHLADKYEIDAIININFFDCYENKVPELLNKPTISITTDYFNDDNENLHQRLYDFLNHLRS